MESAQTSDRKVSRWKMIAVINVGSLIGIFVSLFIVPPQTPLWIWAMSAGLFLLVMNYFAIKRLSKKANKEKVGLTNTVVGTLGFILLTMEVFFRYLH